MTARIVTDTGAYEGTATGYYFAEWSGYADALYVLLDTGHAGCYATGPYLEHAIAELKEAGVPQIENPFAD